MDSTENTDLQELLKQKPMAIIEAALVYTAGLKAYTGRVEAFSRHIEETVAVSLLVSFGCIPTAILTTDSRFSVFPTLISFLLYRFYVYYTASRKVSMTSLVGFLLIIARDANTLSAYEREFQSREAEHLLKRLYSVLHVMPIYKSFRYYLEELYKILFSMGSETRLPVFKTGRWVLEPVAVQELKDEFSVLCLEIASARTS